VNRKVKMTHAEAQKRRSHFITVMKSTEIQLNSSNWTTHYYL